MTTDLRRRAALAIYLVQVGSRLAMLAGAPFAAAATVGLLLQQDPAAAALALATALFGASASRFAGLAAGLVGVAMAGWAAPRIRQGLAGWLLHLPSNAAERRTAVILALAAAQVPLALALFALALLARASGRALSLPNVAGVPALVAAAALLAAPSGRRWVSAPAAGLALAAACSASWQGLAASVTCIALAAAAGNEARDVRVQALRSSLAWAPIEDRIALRALGWRAIGAYLWACLPLAAGFLFRLNNHLDDRLAAPALRLGGGLAIVVVLASVAERLAVMRPIWPWARSLPWTTGARAAGDGRLFAIATLPVLVASLFGGWRVWAPLCGVAAIGAALAAAAVRRAPERRTGAAGEVLAVGGLLAAWVALVPWMAVPCGALAPFVMRAAVERERRQRVSRWIERHHVAAGDSLSWSA